MNCKVCNTRMARQATNCLNCGNAAGSGASGRDESRSDTMPLPNARRVADPGEEADRALAKAGIGSNSGAPKAPAPPSDRGDRGHAAPGPRELRDLLAQRPESLDSGLSVYSDDRGVPSGVGFSTAVGEIDLLARDGSGAFVVILIADHEGAEELVAAILQRMGWVRKHLGKGKGKVRGVVLVDREPESLSYAAAAVADTVAFMTYRLALSFEPVEL